MSTRMDLVAAQNTSDIGDAMNKRIIGYTYFSLLLRMWGCNVKGKTNGL